MSSGLDEMNKEAQSLANKHIIPEFLGELQAVCKKYGFDIVVYKDPESPEQAATIGVSTLDDNNVSIWDDHLTGIDNDWVAEKFLEWTA